MTERQQTHYVGDDCDGGHMTIEERAERLERLTKQRRAEIERYASRVPWTTDQRYGADAAASLLAELRAVEAENRTLREGLDKVIEHIDSHGRIGLPLDHLCGDGGWFDLLRTVAQDTLARAGGGADA